ncbi:MAG: indole-3-glycerol phosphate synthase TrpC [Chitinispirillaceae bacterium]|nr:indole-3-glycerol phosphate synthase TrpC [Chitinispirillaceae bacterium]
MPTFLDTILEQKKAEVAQLRHRRFPGRASPGRSFCKALDKRPYLSVIAEIKKASPSKGVIRHDFDPVAIARAYEQGGASALSVLTDEKFFQGHPDYLTAVSETSSLPVLRKDFIIDPLQVEQTAAMGADAMLLIAEALEPGQLADLYQAARELAVEALIELHGVNELDKVMRVSPPMLGINNRDLFSFATDLRTTLELMGHIPEGVSVVSESGISGASDARLLRDAGVRALLVGESLMRSNEVKGLIRELSLEE